MTENERDYAWLVFGIALLILLAVIGVCADQVWGAAGDPLAQEVTHEHRP